jgi:hypothetical protein
MNSNKTAFFLDAPSKRGKTFLLKTIANKIKMKGGFPIIVASTAIASNDYPNGRTAYSIFGVLNEISSDMICKVSKQRKQLIIKSELIIFDECPIIHQNVIESIDRLLREIMQNEILFSGKKNLFF